MPPERPHLLPNSPFDGAFAHFRGFHVPGLLIFSSRSIFLTAVRKAAVDAAHSWRRRPATSKAAPPSTRHAIQASAHPALAERPSRTIGTITPNEEQTGHDLTRNSWQPLP